MGSPLKLGSIPKQFEKIPRFESVTMIWNAAWLLRVQCQQGRIVPNRDSFSYIMQSGAKGDIAGQAAERPDGQARVNPHAECRALVVIEAASVRERPAPQRHSAFLAHLIATREQHPQTRIRRRAEPGEALRAYAATARMVGR